MIWVLWIFFLFVGWLPAHAWAQGPATPSSRFFDCPVLVFFEPCPVPLSSSAASAPAVPPLATAPHQPPAPAVPVPPHESPEPAGSLWGEPTGQGQVYMPPQAVREFLDQPTPENAQAYLKWNTQRIKAIQRALVALQKETPRQGLPSPAPFPSAKSPKGATPLLVRADNHQHPSSQSSCPGSPANGLENGYVELPKALKTLPIAFQSGRQATAIPLKVLYVFATPWCPYSARQTPLVAAWARRHPDMAVLGVAMDSAEDAIAALPRLPFPVQAGSQALKAKLEIRAYPTLIFFRDGVPVRTRQGFADAAELEALHYELAK